jgi:hypothetical protein
VALVYFDSSALVKLVVDEDGSDIAATLWNACDVALSSRLAHPEVCAALAAAGRNHDLTEAEVSSARSDWDLFWASVRPVELSADVERAPGRLQRLIRSAGPTPCISPAHSHSHSAPQISRSRSGTSAFTPAPQRSASPSLQPPSDDITSLLVADLDCTVRLRARHLGGLSERGFVSSARCFSSRVRPVTSGSLQSNSNWENSSTDKLSSSRILRCTRGVGLVGTRPGAHCVREDRKHEAARRRRHP